MRDGGEGVDECGIEWCVAVVSAKKVLCGHVDAIYSVYIYVCDVGCQTTRYRNNLSV